MAANIDSSLQITVQLDAPPVGRQGFGTCLLLDVCTIPERVRYYTTLTAAQADRTAGLISAAQLAGIQAAFNLKRARPRRVGVARRAADQAKVVTITIGGTVEDGQEFSVTVNGNVFTDTATVPADDAAAVAAALRGVIAVSGITVGGAGANITLTAAVAGEDFDASVEVTAGTGTIAAVVTTANRSIATELDAILAEKSDWISCSLVSRTDIDNERASAWADLNNRFFYGQTSSAAAKAGALSANILKTVKDLGLNWAQIVWRSADSEQFAFALSCRLFAVNPDVSAFQQKFALVEGFTSDSENLTQTELDAILAQNGNAYVNFKGQARVASNVMATGRAWDVQLTKAWLEARIAEAQAQALIDASDRNSKIPYDDLGFAALGSAAMGVLRTGVQAGHLSDDPQPPVVRFPRRVDVAPEDAAAGRVSYEFGGVLKGGVIEIIGTGYISFGLEQIALLATA